MSRGESMAKVRDEFENLVVKNTNEEIGDIIGHNTCERKIFTTENNDIIYKRLKEETRIQHFPFLGPCVDFGMGDICLEEAFEEGKPIYKVYCIDRATKFDYQEFELVEDAIIQLAEMYVGYEIESSDEMTSIMFEVLNLTNKKIKQKTLEGQT